MRFRYADKLTSCAVARGAFVAAVFLRRTNDNAQFVSEFTRATLRRLSLHTAGGAVPGMSDQPATEETTEIWQVHVRKKLNCTERREMDQGG